MAGLVIDAFLVVWDWSLYFAGVTNQYFSGISHLIVDAWWFILVVTGLKYAFGVSTGTCIFLSLLAFAAAMPFAVIVMRAPF